MHRVPRLSRLASSAVFSSFISLLLRTDFWDCAKPASAAARKRVFGVPGGGDPVVPPDWALR
ncbi:hypothetical protein I551_7909 [Mycobacterium ulcerans str. Harvey]|uniref:Secreted protein n=1 Tax=Mycobacterium ulcerans str. Harvey TaxID=1299332 RepID=A0ABN0QLV2_MYCUL|nr:hypothetical protein I551_7909 [Mycobacterium ulcerans str. Harvey]